MSKESVSALIKAIQATTDLLVSKGLTRRQQLVSKTSDDSYVQDLEDVYSSGIDTIVENIPDDPPPTPPTPPVDPRDAIPRNYGDSPDAGTDAGAGADNNYE